MSDTLKYKIKEGDNLTKIVKHLYDKNIDVIGDNPDLIYPDSMLTISVIPSQREPDSIFIVDSPPVDYSIQAWGLLGCLLLISIVGLLRKPKSNLIIEHVLPSAPTHLKDIKPSDIPLSPVMGAPHTTKEVPMEEGSNIYIKDVEAKNLKSEKLSSSASVEDQKAKIKKLRNN